MKIKLSLTAPEFAPLIPRYNDFFHENHAYSLDWNYEMLPRVGEHLAFSLIADLIKEHIDLVKLPAHWEIVAVKWNKEIDKVTPTLFIVGK